MTEARSLPRRLAWSLVGLLDWMLPAMLLAALALAVMGAHYLHAGRWSLGALVWGCFGAVQGATVGATAWASWTATRRLNILVGILGGVTFGLATHAMLSVVYPLIAAEIVRYPEPAVPAMQRALQAWCASAPIVSQYLFLIAAITGCVAFVKQQRATSVA